MLASVLPSIPEVESLCVGGIHMSFLRSSFDDVWHRTRTSSGLHRCNAPTYELHITMALSNLPVHYRYQCPGRESQSCSTNAILVWRDH